jgi:2-phospho-L-lactate transferase
MTTQRTGSDVSQADANRILALSGGVGGAKLALGLSAVLNAGALTIAVNTADDFEHLGLHVSPDLDTVLYTLAGLSDPVRGWGRAEESWNFMGALASLGGETWFALGDRDLAVHVERTRRLRAGASLTFIRATVRCPFRTISSNIAAGLSSRRSLSRASPRRDRARHSSTPSRIPD